MLVQTYIAILRGINVGGHTKIKMSDLKSAMEESGFSNVSTYIQSGNIFFSTAVSSREDLSMRISALIKNRFGADVPVIIRSQRELREILKNSPFLGDPDIDTTKLHVTFLSGVPGPSVMANFSRSKYLPDQFSIRSSDVYLYCPNGYGRTKLTNGFFEKTLRLNATTRNWRTVGKLAGPQK
ncbi:MAG TPA: DUF1697 domain-containing protein [Bacteroidales bacterium]|nr:DUF1697 domain-containing protein [Bacteroidales bacterium]